MGDAIAQQPVWLQTWIYWMVVMNLGGLVFAIWRVEARWVVGAFIANGIFMSWLYEAQGYTRLLGISHVIFWTPLVVYVFRRLPGIDTRSAYGVWVRAVVATNAVSLVVDYVDVIRYLLGERAPLL